MSRQYSPRNFLRHAPNELLARYFQERNLLTDLDIASLPETEVQPIFDAWMALPPEQSAEVNSDFELVASLADEQGVQAILDEADYHHLDLTDAFESMPGFFDKALWTFLEHQGVAEVANRFCEAERFPASYWIRRREGVLGAEPRDDADALAKLGEALAAYFRLKEGRGRECLVDVYRRGTKLYYFAFPEDYAQTALEYTGTKKLERRAHRPIFELVFVCDPELGALDTYFRGRQQARLAIETIFCRVILDREFDTWKDDRLYDLNAFKRRDVRFVYDPASGIQDVRVKLLRLSLLGGGSRRVVLEADPSADKGAVYDLLEELFDCSDDGSRGRLPLALPNVTRVGLLVLFSPGGRRGKHTKTFYLTYPNGCTLGHDGRDKVLRQMIVDSKIETSQPATARAKA
jgi:hypothetical protein